jgi:hypothetical protein
MRTVSSRMMMRICSRLLQIFDELIRAARDERVTARNMSITERLWGLMEIALHKTLPNIYGTDGNLW